MTWTEEKNLIKQQMGMLPETFSLRGFPGETFRVNFVSSYVDGSDNVILYLDVKKGERWITHSKGTIGQIQSEIA